jgi:hypothetical protein
METRTVSFRVIPSHSESFRVIPSHSESFRVIQSHAYRAHVPYLPSTTTTTSRVTPRVTSRVSLLTMRELWAVCVGGGLATCAAVDGEGGGGARAGGQELDEENEAVGGIGRDGEPQAEDGKNGMPCAIDSARRRSPGSGVDERA